MSMPRPFRTPVDRLLAALPRGVGLSEQEFETRHGLLRLILLLHVPALTVFGLVRGFDVTHVATDVMPIVIALVVARTCQTQPWRAFWVTAGLSWCSTVLVHLSDGQIESHFHYFVVVGLIALYQRWLPFAWAIGFTVLSHGLGSALSPGSMFNHTAAVERPWLWAGIHGVALLAAAIAQVVFWAAAERDRTRFESVVSNAFDGVAILDGGATTASWVSPAMTRITGVEAGDDVLDVIAPDDQHRAERALGELLTGEASTPFLVQTIEPGMRWIEVAGVDMTDHPAVGGIVLNVRDVTDRRRAEQDLTWQASHDPLTGLANRSYANDLIAREVRSGDGELSLMFVDVDGFKDVNDQYGHAVGDRVLSEVARRIARVIRSTDTVARLGGDEFVVICPRLSDEETLLALAERLVEAVSTPMRLDGTDLVTTVSVGAAVHTDDMTADELLRVADTAMFAAKSLGRDRAELFDPSLHSLRGINDLTSQLRHAIDDGGLVVHFQPIVSLTDLSSAGMEALVRWNHPMHGMISPAEFIPAAEEHGMIHDLGALVMREAAAGLLRWDPDGDTYVAVNVSGRQLQRRSFAGVVRRVLEETGLPPGQFNEWL
ncbi:MAG: diguanylate cyclase, partial [Actinomycetota bacterium]